MRKRAARRRLLVVVVLLVVIALAFLGWWQGYARRRGGFSPVEQALFTVLTPGMRLTAAVREQVMPAPQYAMDPQQQLPRVGMERLTALEEENRQLRALLQLRDALPQHAIAAEVIGRGINPWQSHLLLGKGSADGVTPHMLALTPDGVLGQVITVAPHHVAVLLLTDRASGIGGMIARTRETGVLKGAQGGQCQLLYLSDKADAQVGDTVITSGLSDYFPKGLPLGTIVSVADDPALSSRTAIVAPIANPATVEMVVLTK